MNKRRFLLFGAAAVAAGAVWISSTRSSIRQAGGLRSAGPYPITLVDRKAAIPMKLAERKTLTHDTHLFRFALPNADHVLGLPIGQHVHLQTVLDGKKLVRAYTPVSSDNDKGIMDLVIKLYRPNPDAGLQGGQMSGVLDKLKPGDTLDVRGPTGRFFYGGNGKLGFKQHKSDPGPTRFEDTKKIVMLAGGSGITPMLQLIKHVLSDPADDTKLELLFANKSEDDIMLRGELETLAAEHPKQFKLWYTVDKAPKGWKYSKGFINADLIKQHLSPPAADTFVFICGPKPMIKNACVPALKVLNFPEERIHIF